MFTIICPECGTIFEMTEDDWRCWRCGYTGVHDFDEEEVYDV